MGRDEDTRKRIAIGLFIIWIVLVGYAIFGVHTNTVTAIQPSSPTLNVNGVPAVFTHMVFYFQATGSISVGNPITVTAVVYQTNDSNFLQDVCCVTFTGAYNITQSAAGGIGFNTGFIRFHSTGNGTYEGKGTVNWVIAGGTLPLFITPQEVSQGFVRIPESTVTNGSSPLVVLGTEADTLSWQNNEAQQKLTLVLVAFSFIAFEPLIEAYLKLKPK